MEKTSETRLNFTANSFFRGHKDSDNAPRFLVICHARWKLPKCVWTSQETT